jgi:sugar lactone lactonase YvrE
MSIRLRASLCGGLFLLFTNSAISQTMEVVTGAGRYVDVPATSIPFATDSMARGPDGRFYLANVIGNLIRFDPANGTATALPANESGLSFQLNNSHALAFDANGDLHLVVSGRVLRIDPVAGTTVDTGSLFGSVRQMVFAPDGTLYYVTQDSRVRARLPSGTTVVVAGTGVDGFSGDGGPAVDAQLYGAFAIARGPDGDIYVSDTPNNRIRRISVSDGTITTFVGSGNTQFNGDGLVATLTNIYRPDSLAFDAAGNLYFTDGNYRLRRVDVTTRVVTTVAGTGSAGSTGNTGDGGLATAARVFSPKGITFDTAGNLYFADIASGPGAVRRIAADTGIITRALGSEESHFCGENVPARSACFGHAYGLSFDAAGSLLVTDVVTRRVRKLDASTGLVATLAPTPGLSPLGIDHDQAGNAFVAMYGGYQINRIDAFTAAMTRYAGLGGYGFGGDGGIATAASFASPTDVAVDALGNLYIADQGNNRIRKVDATGIVSTLATFTGPATVELDGTGGLLVAGGECRIRRIDVNTGASTSIAGTGDCGANDLTLTGQAIFTPIGSYPTFTIAPDGSIFLSWSRHIYRLDSTGWMTRVPAPSAGLTTPEGLGFTHPSKMKFDAGGRLYLTDSHKPHVFRITGLIDATPPVIEPQITGTLGSNGWYRSDAHLEWTVTDPESAIVSSDCPTPTIPSDTAGIAIQCRATSLGGTTVRSVTIRRDTTAPVISFGPPSPAANAGGWNNTDVSIAFTASDATSGIATVGALSPIVIATEGTGVEMQFAATDQAGNSATFATPAVNIDKTPPSIALLHPEAGRNYGAFASIAAQYTCSDAQGLAVLCNGTLASGAPLPTNTAGAKSFTVNAADAAGNVASTTRSYSVAPLQFERFIEPLRRSPTFNGVTAGSLVPIRWRMLDGTGQAVTNPAAFQSFTVFNLTCQGTPIPLNDTATGGAGLSVNPANGYFTYNWQTDAAWAGTCRRVQIRLGDNSVKEVVFRLQ